MNTSLYRGFGTALLLVTPFWMIVAGVVWLVTS